MWLPGAARSLVVGSRRTVLAGVTGVQSLRRARVTPQTLDELVIVQALRLVEELGRKAARLGAESLDAHPDEVGQKDSSLLLWSTRHLD